MKEYDEPQNFNSIYNLDFYSFAKFWVLTMVWLKIQVIRNLKCILVNKSGRAEGW